MHPLVFSRVSNPINFIVRLWPIFQHRRCRFHHFFHLSLNDSDRSIILLSINPNLFIAFSSPINSEHFLTIPSSSAPLALQLWKSTNHPNLFRLAWKTSEPDIRIRLTVSLLFFSGFRKTRVSSFRCLKNLGDPLDFCLLNVSIPFLGGDC